MNTLQAALRYRAAGLATIPIWPDERKNPHLSSITEYTERLPSIAELRRWFNRWPAANIGLITGYWGYVALDFDTTEAYQAWQGPKGQTWTVKTARGYHVWFWLNDQTPGKSRTYHKGKHEVLLRAKGGYCIAPPSIHHTGARYSTVHNVKPLAVDALPLDGWAYNEPPASPQAPKQPDLLPPGQITLEQLVPIPEGSKPNGRGAYQVYCPFHSDKNPSAWLNPQEQRFGCNACWPGLWWDTANIYAKMFGVSNEESCKVVYGNKNLPELRLTTDRPPA